MGEMKRAVAREEQERRNQDRFASTVVIAAAIIAASQLRRELLLACLCQAVILRPPIVLRHLPFRSYPSLVLKAIERWIKRTLPDLQNVFRQLLDTLRHPPPMHWLKRERLKDQ